MYLKVMLAITGVLLLLIAGCPKEQQDSESAAASGGKQPAARAAEESAGAGDAEPAKSSDVGQIGEVTAEQEQLIRDALLETGSNLGLTYDKKADALMGEGLPAKGINIPELVKKTASVIQTSNIEFSEQTIAKVARSMVVDEMPRPEGAEPSRPPRGLAEEPEPPSGKQKKGDLAAGSKQIDRSKLKAATQLIGDWKSTKEIHTRFTAQHNADYFEYVNVSPDNKIMFKVYRDGELISDRVFDFTFDKKSGEIKLKDESGSVVNRITAYNMGEDDTMLYLEYKSGTITVYDQVSRVGVPLTEEEKAGVAQPGVGER